MASRLSLAAFCGGRGSGAHTHRARTCGGHVQGDPIGCAVLYVGAGSRWETRRCVLAECTPILTLPPLPLGLLPPLADGLPLSTGLCKARSRSTETGAWPTAASLRRCCDHTAPPASPAARHCRCMY